MENVDNSLDADKYLAATPTIDVLIKIACGAVAALTHVHGLNLVHTDVKPSNVFVDAGGRPVLADFGFAKRVDLEGKTRGIGGTAGYIYPEQARLMAETSVSRDDEQDPNRQASYAEFDRSQLKLYWDLYSLGVTILVLIQVVLNERPGTRSDYRVRYLLLMAYRLLGTTLNTPAARPIS
jgi:serine/threonine protein kinase